MVSMERMGFGLLFWLLRKIRTVVEIFWATLPSFCFHMLVASCEPFKMFSVYDSQLVFMSTYF